MQPKLKFKIELELSGKDGADAQRRLNAYMALDTYLDTDVLEILARKAPTKGINEKVRMMKNMI